MRKFLQLICKSINYVIQRNKYMGKRVPDELFLKIKYLAATGSTLNLNNPKTFNEKIQWLKIHDREEIYTDTVDKYKVREYVEKYVGAEYLIPLLGVWKSVDDIDFNQLPNQFVLKCNHDSGGVRICKDKESFDMEKAKKFLRKQLKKNYFWETREWPYLNIEPLILAEKYIIDSKNEDLKDYKFWCFHGQVKVIHVASNRNVEKGLRMNFYNQDWELLEFTRDYPQSEKEIIKPSKFEEMKDLAEKLSKNNKFLRVDFYEVDNRIYFGEITYYPGSGLVKFDPDEYDLKFGEMINL